MSAPESLAIAAARHAARGGLPRQRGDDRADQEALATIIHTVADQARELDVSLTDRIAAQTAALALTIAKATRTCADAAPGLVQSACLLLPAQVAVAADAFKTEAQASPEKQGS